MKGPKFQEMSDASLDADLRDMEKDLWTLRFKAATGQAEGLRRVRTLRRNIARVKTIQRERELLALSEAEGSKANGQ